MEYEMRIIGSKIKQFCHNILLANIVLVIFQVSALQADTNVPFTYINSSAEYAQTVSGARPRGITASENYIFVADAGRNAIAIYSNDAAGKLLLLHKGQSTIDGVISYPYDIAYNKEKDLLVLMDQFSTYTRFVVYKFIKNTDGTVALDFDYSASIEDKYAGISINDTGDKLYALASDGSHILFLDIASENISGKTFNFDTPLSKNSFAGIDYYFDGTTEYLAISDSLENKVYLYIISQTTVSLNKTLPLAKDSTEINLVQPTDVDIWKTESGKLVFVITNRANSSISLFDFETGEFLLQITNPGTSKSKLSFPYCSTGVDGSTEILVADSNNRRVAAYNVDASVFTDSDDDETLPEGNPDVEIKFTAITMTNLVVSLTGVDPTGNYMIDYKEKLTDTWVPALQSNIYIPASQSDFPIANNSYVGSSEVFEIFGTITESADTKKYSLDIPISIFVEQNDAANINSSFFRFRRVAQ
jgi:hypothetical protein